MRYVYAVIMLVFSVIAFFYSTRVFYNKNYKKITYRLFSLMAFASGIWSLGYGMMFLQDSTERFAIYRALGMIGIILFIIFGQLVLMIMASTLKKLWPLLLFETITGISVLAMALKPSSFIMEVTENGIITTFTSNVISLAYTLYCVVIAVVFAFIAGDMAKKKNTKRLRAFGRSFLKVEGLIVAGMVVDTLLPAFGINPNIPASTMMQFLGIEIVYYCVHKFNRNMISLENMTGYIYQSLKSPVLVFNSDNKVRLSNNQANVLLGKSTEELSQMADFWERTFNVSAPDDISELENTLNVDCIYQEKGMHCRVSVDAIFDEYKDFIGYIMIITDMTEHINNIKMIEQAKDEAEYANKAKSMFLANMSHEIRTPMNSILGFAEIALRSDMDVEAKRYFSDIHKSAKILLSTINDILDISKLESGKMEIVNAPYFPAEIFKEVSTVIEMQASMKKIKFGIYVSPDIPNKLIGDKTRIREILINLLNNGIKYTKEGSVMLFVELASANDTMARMRFKIIDTGIGIKKEDVAGIFDSFKRVDLTANRKTEGTGLGLSITKAFIDLMGGDIAVESEYGKGSTFIVEINQEIVDASPINYQEEISDEEHQKLMFKNTNVLAVDDNQINLKVISNAMSQYGLKIDVATCGEDAIIMCQKKQYDIVLMDHMMPVMDGVEAMQKIRELGNGYEVDGHNKIVALTANTLSGVEEEMIAYGFDGFLGKPIEFNVLEKMFIEFLSDDQYYYETEGPSKKLKESFPMLDYAAGLQCCAGKEEMYIKALTVVAKTGLKDIEDASALLHDGSDAEYQKKIQRLKGKCNNIGAANLAQKIETDFDTFAEEFKALIEQIKTGLENF